MSHVSIREHFRDVREDLFLIALFHARLNVALIGDITCRTEHVEGASAEAQKEKYYQPPWRRACVAIKSPTDHRTYHDTSDKLTGQFHGLCDRSGCFRSLILGSRLFENTLFSQLGLETVQTLIQPPRNSFAFHILARPDDFPGSVPLVIGSSFLQEMQAVKAHFQVARNILTHRALVKAVKRLLQKVFYLGNAMI